MNVRFHIPGTKCVADTREPAIWANAEEGGVQGNGGFAVCGGLGGAVIVERKVGARLGRFCFRGVGFCILPRKCSGSLLVFLILKTGSHQAGYVLCTPSLLHSLRAGTISVLSPLCPQGPAQLCSALVDT